MSQSIIHSERITAILSTLVAIAILAAGVTAHQSRAPLDELERLEADLQFQLDWAFRHDTKERSRRLARLEETLDAWRASPRSEEDRKLLATWLLESTIRSMPGTTKPLPTVPQFGKPTVVALAEPIAAQLEESKVEQPKSIEKAIEKKTVQMTAVAADIRQQATLLTTPTNHDVAVLGEIPEKTAHKASSIVSPEHNVVVLDEVADGTANLVLIAEPNNAQPENSLAKLPQISPPEMGTVKVDPPKEEMPSKRYEEPVRINLTELAARIAGYHASLDQIETELLFAKSPDLNFLEKRVKELRALTRDFRFVKLYYAALSEKERKQISAPRWMSAALAEIERLIQQNESQQEGDFLGSFDSAQQKQIEDLRQQLATIVNRKE